MKPLARRLAAILAVAAYVVPWLPRLLHTPRVRYNDYGAAGVCALASFAFLLCAFATALFGVPKTGRRDYWTKVLAVGLFWFISATLVPI